MKLPLQKRYSDVVRGVHWTSSKPFVENKQAVLIHRPRSVMTYKAHWGEAYPIVDYWCGASANGSGKFTFLDEPPANKLVCMRCEAQAKTYGMPSSDQIVGKHVHIGSLVGVRQCCQEKS